jgi:anti-sigma factor RsiW
MESNTAACSRTDNDLSLFVGGELDPAARRELHRHLETCAESRRRAHAARAAHVARVQVLNAHDGRGPDLWPALRAELAREGLLAPPATGTTPAPIPPTASRRFASWTRAAAAAALVLCGAWAARGWLEADDGATEPMSAVVREVRPAGDGPIVAQPVANANGEGRLRPLGRGERALHDSALILGGEEPVYAPGFAPKRPAEYPVPVNGIELGPPRR